MSLFTINYHQPEFYHFSQTSVEAAEFISKIIPSYSLESLYLIDFFAGSGVLSLETLARLNGFKTMSVDLIEVQSDFKNSLKENTENLKKIKNEVSFNIYCQNVSSWIEENKISSSSIIVLNPPHFFLNETQRAKNKNSDLCKNMEEKDWIEIVGKILSLPVHAIFMQLRVESNLTRKTLELIKNHKYQLKLLSGQECLVCLELFNQ